MNRFFLALAAITLAASPASAHLAPGAHGSFLAGASHPLFGLDHVLAMVAVGLWAAMLGGRALVLVPAAFVSTMVIGFGLAMAGVGLPFVEPAILASVVVLGLGLVVAMSVRLPAAAGALLVGAFALFHGHAHGGELGTAAALPYMAGFAISTALLHGAGLGLGVLATGVTGRIATRIAGGLTAALGLGLAVGAI